MLRCLLVVSQLDEDSGSSDNEECGNNGETQLYVPPKVRAMYYGKCVLVGSRLQGTVYKYIGLLVR